jgi:peroxiredoxin
VAQLCQKINRFQELNTRVLVITFGTLPAAQAWLGETCAPLRVFLDPERVAYQAYELERSYLRAWGLKTMWRYVRLLTAGRKWRGIQGDSAQLGGDFIIDTNGIIRLAYRSHNPTDRPSANDLISCLEQYTDVHQGN